MAGFSKGIANVGIRSRLKQIIALMVIIFVGILISQAVQAQGYHKSKSRHYKTKYRSQIRMNDRACHVLNRKRSEEPKAASLAIFKRKPKYKPQAEVDGTIVARNN